MVKMEIELTEDQFEKVEILKSKGVDAGEAVDLLFGLQKEIISQIEEQKQEEYLIEKIYDTGFDTQIKQNILKKSYAEGETYDKTLQDAKHNVKWSEFFRF